MQVGTPVILQNLDSALFYLQHGDFIEAEVRQIGTLETRIRPLGG